MEIPDSPHPVFKRLKKIKDNRNRRRRQAARSARSTSQRIDDLEDEVMFANLVNRTLFSLLTQKGLLQQNEFIEHLAELDAEDGNINGGSSGDDLARQLGFESLPVDREKEGPKAPVPKKKR